MYLFHIKFISNKNDDYNFKIIKVNIKEHVLFRTYSFPECNHTKFQTILHVHIKFNIK